MSDSTQDELTEAKIQLSEQRIETRLVGIEAKIDRVLDRVDAATTAAVRAEDRAEEARVAASNVKWNIVFAALGTMAVLFAAWAIWVQGMQLISSLL